MINIHIQIYIMTSIVEQTDNLPEPTKLNQEPRAQSVRCVAKKCEYITRAHNECKHFAVKTYLVGSDPIPHYFCWAHSPKHLAYQRQMMRERYRARNAHKQPTPIFSQ